MYQLMYCKSGWCTAEGEARMAEVGIKAVGTPEGIFENRLTAGSQLTNEKYITEWANLKDFTSYRY